MNRRILVPVVALCASFALISCGSSKKQTVSGLPERVLASQSVTATLSFGGLVIINGENDTLPRIAPLSAGNSPGLMAITPTRNIAAAFDPVSSAIYTVDTVKESALANVRMPGPVTSMVFPTASQIGYAAIPSATVNGFAVLGAVDLINFSTNSLTTVAVSNAETLVSNSSGTQLLVFNASLDTTSNSITVINPLAAVPPVDLSCYSAPNAVCTIVPGFDRPVYGIIDPTGTTAYILNCGPECGGSQASVAVLDMASLTITNTIPVHAATWAVLSGSTLYVAGTHPNTACTGQNTKAQTCGTLDVVDLASNSVTGSFGITDGYHDRMDLTFNGQLFVGSYNCTNIGNVGNPNGEVRGCLSIVDLYTNTVIFPPDNGDVTGLQGFTTRAVEYVAEGGQLRVYDTVKDILLINDFVPEGTINIVGNVTDVKAIDFF